MDVDPLLIKLVELKGGYSWSSCPSYNIFIVKTKL